MKTSRFIDNIYEGRWKVISVGGNHAKLVNIFNEKEITIHYTSLQKIDKGTTTISKIICCRVNRDKATKTFKDVSQFRQRQFAYRKKLERGEL